MPDDPALSATPSRPGRVLVVAGRDAPRRAALAALAPAAAAPLVVAPHELPVPLSFPAVVLDVPLSELPEGGPERLLAAVRAGASLLVTGGLGEAAPSGPAAGDPVPLIPARAAARLEAGEWFAKVPFPAGDLTRRLPAEIAVEDELVLLEPLDGAAVVLGVSVGLRERAAVVERRTGAGRVVVTGLGGTAGALAQPHLVRMLRRSLLPAAGVVAERPVGVGVLGFGAYGGMGQHHGRAARATDGLELVAACDADPARRKAAAAEFPGLHTVASADELAADDDVEIVVVATPPSSHAALGLQMLRAGKHVVLEKPMCLTLAEADQLLGTAEACGVALTVYQCRRWDADFLALRRAVDRGLLGELFNVETFVGGFEHPCRAWHSDVAVSGGAVYDWGSHHLDWILQLYGEMPASLAAFGHKRVWHDVTNLDQVRVRLTWRDGREAEFVQSDVAGVRRPKFYVQGTRGTLVGHYRPVLLERLEPGLGYRGDRLHHAEAPAELLLAAYEPGYGVSETVLPPAPLDSYPFHRNLADHVHLGEPLAVTPASARQVVALLEAAQRSTDLGNVPVDLPADPVP